MANNRLYIVNTNTKEYCCIAKHDGYGWNLGNIDILKEFLEETPDFHSRDTDLALYTEYDRKMDEVISSPNSKNYNTTNEWEYA